ncbi:MAG: hypothetical protein KKH45_10590 [Proteobacteria bacterium]|nr:hypothetical protein [Pseudomonadota bacterium]
MHWPGVFAGNIPPCVLEKARGIVVRIKQEIGKLNCLVPIDSFAESLIKNPQSLYDREVIHHMGDSAALTAVPIGCNNTMQAIPIIAP